MKNCYRCTFIALCVFVNTAIAQTRSIHSFRLGPAFSFGLSNIANNNVGLGAIAGAEKRLNKLFSVELEGSYTYFTGDDILYTEGKNKAFSMPLLAGIKIYPVPNVYGSARVGAIYFLLNQMSVAQVRLAYGLAGGFNLPRKINRLNVQLGYTGFGYTNVQHGYATLALAIIIN